MSGLKSDQDANRERHPKLTGFEKKLQLPMLILSFVWLCILITELVHGTTPVLSGLGTALWILFVIYFFLRLVAAQSKLFLIKKNWLFIIAILASILRFFPALQSFVYMRSLTASLGIQVVWIFVSADQGIRFMHRALGRRGAGYVLAFTAVVIFAGAAGMLHFESLSEAADRIQNYPDALWWTAMQMTNIGSSYNLRTSGGRILCLAISIYAAGMFGYLTALFATLIIDRDIKTPKIEVTSLKELQDVKAELVRLATLIENFTKNAVTRK